MEVSSRLVIDFRSVSLAPLRGAFLFARKGRSRYTDRVIMRLLFVTPAPPDRPDRDGMTQIAHALIRELGRDNVIDVWSLDRVLPNQNINVPGARETKIFSAPGVNLVSHYLRASTRPFFQARHESPALHDALRQLDLGAYDLVILHTPFVAHYLSDIKLPVVVHVIDALSDWFKKAAAKETNPLKKWHLRTEAQRAQEMEKTILPQAQAIIVVSDVDAQTISGFVPDRPIVSIPIGIDPEIFFPPTAKREPETIVMTGIMNYPPNIDAAVWFVNNVWPAVITTRPQAQLRIVGKNPAPVVIALSKVSGVIVTGRVPSIADELRRATIAVSPLRFGTGYKIKINEALACGIPLIASPVSLAGTGATPGTHCLSAETIEEWVTAINGLLTNPAQQSQLSRQGLSLAASLHWSVIAEKYYHVYVQAKKN